MFNVTLSTITRFTTLAPLSPSPQLEPSLCRKNPNHGLRTTSRNHSYVFSVALAAIVTRHYNPKTNPSSSDPRRGLNQGLKNCRRLERSAGAWSLGLAERGSTRQSLSTIRWATLWISTRDVKTFWSTSFP